MTSQEKIEFLERYKNANLNIDRLLDERAGWWARATKITPTLSDMPKGGNSDSRIQMAIDKMCEIDDKINEEIDNLQNIKVEVMGAIKTVPDESKQLLLEYWYINCMKPIAIARKLHYSPDGKNVFKMHKKAIDMVQVDTPLH